MTKGGAVLDLSARSEVPLQLGTSNPGVVSHHVGGVAHNVALTLHRLGTSLTFLSAVGKDPQGTLVLSQMQREGLVGGNDAADESLLSTF